MSAAVLAALIGLTITQKVTNLSPSQFFNKDDAGVDQPGRKSIQVNMAGGFSFRTVEGDDMFQDVCDYVRIGTIIQVGFRDIDVKPYTTTQSTATGSEVEVTQYFKNLTEPTLKGIEEAERNPQFEGLQKKEEPLVFAHKEGRARQRRGAQSPETLPEGAVDAKEF
jgi:hypothetical protein